MNASQLIAPGLPSGEPARLAQEFTHAFVISGGDSARRADEISAIIAPPHAAMIAGDFT